MELLCPSCQRRLTIPDQYAGQMMKCPLCNNTFTAPALAPVPGPATAPPPPAPNPNAAPPAPPLSVDTGPTHVRPEEPPAPPPPPPGDYTHRFSVWISPHVVPWVALGAVVLVFLLTFFPWLRAYTRAVTVGNIEVPAGDVSENAWGAAFSSPVNVLMIFYVLLLILLLLVSIAAAVVPLFAGSLPPAVRDLLKWRYALAGGLALVSFLCLLLQLVVGFTLEHQPIDLVSRTFFLSLAFGLHLVAVICCLLVLWTDLRGNRPIPRVDIVW